MTLVISWFTCIQLALLAPQTLKHGFFWKFLIYFFLKFGDNTSSGFNLSLFGCQQMHKLLFVLAALCVHWSSVKTLVTRVVLSMGRLTGGLQVKWCSVSSLTSTPCPKQSISLLNTLTRLIWSASLPWSSLTVHICISPCDLLHLTKSSSTL